MNRLLFAVAGLLMTTAILLTANGLPVSQARASTGPASGTEFVTFWSGDLRIFAHEDNTRVTLIDIDTGANLTSPLTSDSRISSANLNTNPFTLSLAGDAFEGIGGLDNPNAEIRVRIVTEDSTGGSDDKPVTVWTGSLDNSTRHPVEPPSDGNPWMSYIPAFSQVVATNGTELGQEFLGFTTKEMYIFALKGPNPTSITIDDLATNTDFDADDSTILNATSPELVFSNTEIEVYFLDDFEDDTVKITSNVDASVLVGYSSTNQSDWTVTPPSYAAGDEGIELGTLFYTFAKRELTIFSTQDDTTVTITDLSDSDDSNTIILANGDIIGDYDLYTPTLASTTDGNIIPDPGTPLVNIINNSGNTFDDDFVKVESDKPILVYVGPVGSDIREYADVAFSVPTGPDSRIIYAFAQNGGSNDLQIFGFDPDTVVTITSLSQTAAFRNNGQHDFTIGPGFAGAEPWKEGTAGSDIWWGENIWNGEMLRIESDKPITVINGDYDFPTFGAFVPFVLATPTLPPVADAGEPQSICVRDEVQFDGTGSFDQDTVAGGSPVSYEWDFDINMDSDGDNIPENDVDSTAAMPTHTYSSTGTFTAKLTFTDDDGETDTDFVEIDVQSCGCDDALLSNYQTTKDSLSVEITNAGSVAISLDGCSLVTFDVFTETSIEAATISLSLAGILNPGDTVLVIVFDEALPTGPGAIGIYHALPPPDATPFSITDEITGMVYLDSDTVFGVGHLRIPSHNEIYECIYGGSGQGPFMRPFTPVEDCLSVP